MSGQRRPRQTGLLGQAPPESAQEQASSIQTDRPTVEAPSHLLFQIGVRPNPVTTIGRRINDCVVLGRADPPDGFVPDVDLTPYQAAEKGVSRRHLIILRSNESLFIQDAGSRNGTKLNDTPLQQEQPYPLHDGDELILGGLRITVWYVTAD